MKSVVWNSINAGRTWKMQDPELGWRYGDGAKLYNLTVPLREIQQIDSLNVVATNDSGILVHSTDAGNSWQNTHLTGNAPYGSYLHPHFSDRLTGIVSYNINLDSTQNKWRSGLLFTHDGGEHWDTVKGSIGVQGVQNSGAIGYSFGEGKYRIFRYPIPRILTTLNNWETVDSTPIILPFDSDTSKKYYIQGVELSGDDTLIGYGIYYASLKPLMTQAFIIRSTNAGMSWDTPRLFPQFYNIFDITQLNRDTIYARTDAILFGSSHAGENKVLMSIDRGKSWLIDTLKLDTNYKVVAFGSISVTADGSPIASVIRQLGYNTPNILIRGNLKSASVSHDVKYTYDTHIYPNPARAELNVLSSHPLSAIRIVDMLGRDVQLGKTNEAGVLQLDVSILSGGVYTVLIENNGVFLPAGKAVITR